MIVFFVKWLSVFISIVLIIIFTIIVIRSINVPLAMLKHVFVNLYTTYQLNAHAKDTGDFNFGYPNICIVYAARETFAI